MQNLTDEGRLYGAAPMTLRSLASSFHGIQGVIGLHGGLPPASLFPCTSMSFTLFNNTTLCIDDPAKVELAQQAGVVQPQGFSSLLTWARDHTTRLHTPPRADTTTIITCSSTTALMGLLALLVPPGGSLLVEAFTYPNLLECNCLPRSVTAVPINMDAQGLDPSHLDAVLTGWDASSNGPCPRVLYTIPTGQNPTGLTQPVTRKRAVYDTCRRHAITIIEDDAYYMLQYPSGPDHVPGLSDLGQSLLSMDVDGRVVRLDTFSKVLSPGLRIGWASGPPVLMDKLVHFLMAASLGAPSIAQMLIAELVSRDSGAVFEEQLKRVQRHYAHKVAVLDSALGKHVGARASWHKPAAGMFLWLRVHGIEDVSEIWDQLVTHKVVGVPGRLCHPRLLDPTFHSPYLRLCFASASDEELDAAAARLGRVLEQCVQAH